MKILFLGANALDTPRLQIPAELRDVKEELERAANRKDIDVRAELAVRPTDLSRLLLDYRPDIVHFSGHGMELRVRTGTTGGTTREFDLPDDSAPQNTSAESAILFENSAGYAVPVPPGALTTLFGILKTQRCIVLNACFSAAQARALSQHVDCVVGMTRTIRDESAIAFAAGFYQALAHGKSVKEAVELGKNLIAICSLPDADVPALYTKSGVDADAVRFLPTASAKERAPFTVPFPQDKRFLGRDDDLKKLHALLEADTAIGVGAVTGMGGIGKTQLAVEYAYRYREAYKGGVYWVNAARDWQEEFARLAGKVGIRDQSATEDERLRWLAQAFVEYLEEHPKSLVIFDNVEDPLELQNRSRDIVPVDLPCRLLFTTRRQTDAFPMVEIRSLDDESALRLLLDTSTRKQLLQQGFAEEQSTARSICKTLGNLPLAIALASAYLEKRPNVPLKAYLKGLVGDGALLVMDGAKVDPRQLPTQHTQGLRATLQEQWAVLRDDGDARAVLQTAALLGEAEQIPRARLSLLTGLADERADWRDPPLDEALRELSEWSLVETLSESAIRLHPLVREFAVGKLGANREAFTAVCAARMADALYDMGRLSKEVERRGVDDVLDDLRAGIGLGARGQLGDLLRPMDREAHVLRGWKPNEMPGFFLQQLRNICQELSIDTVHELAENQLVANHADWLRERFLVGNESPALVRTLVGHTGEVTAVAITGDGRFIVSGSNDRTCKFWDFHTGRCIRTFHCPSPVTAAAATPNGEYVISGSKDGTILIWNSETGALRHRLSVHDASIKMIEVFANFGCLVSISDDNALRAWDIATGALRQTIHAEVDVAALNYHVDSLIFVDKFTGRGRRWNLQTVTEKEEPILCARPDEHVCAIADTRREPFAVFRQRNGSLVSRNLNTRVVLKAIGESFQTNSERPMKITRDNRRAVQPINTSIHIWDLATGESHELQGHADTCTCVTTSKDNRFVISGAQDKALKIWNLHALRKYHTPVISTHERGPISALAFSPDGRMAMCGTETSFTLWNIHTLELMHKVENDLEAPVAMAMVDHGSRVAIISAFGDVRFWNIATGSLTHDGQLVEAMTKRAHAFRFAHDGSLGMDGFDYHLDKSREARLAKAFDPLLIRGIKATDNSIALLAHSRWRLDIWDFESKQLKKPFCRSIRSVTAATLMNKQQLAIVGSSDGSLTFCNFEIQTFIRTWTTAHDGPIHGLTLTTDDQFLISVSQDRTLRIWDVETGKRVAMLEAHAPLLCCAASPDGKTILAGDNAGGLHVLDWRK